MYSDLHQLELFSIPNLLPPLVSGHQTGHLSANGHPPGIPHHLPLFPLHPHRVQIARTQPMVRTESARHVVRQRVNPKRFAPAEQPLENFGEHSVPGSDQPHRALPNVVDYRPDIGHCVRTEEEFFQSLPQDGGRFENSFTLVVAIFVTFPSFC